MSNGQDKTNGNTNAHPDDYWAVYWRNHARLHSADPHFQVGRTVGGVSIDALKWEFHLGEIERALSLQPHDTLLDLCAGNGMISMPLSLKCKSTTAVDISDALLQNIDTQQYPSIAVLVGDLRSMDLPPQSFSKGLMYGALQYFNEGETIGVFETIYNVLQRQGEFLIGDIPDIDRLFQFHRKPEWVRAYFDSVKAGTPAVGYWFKQEVLLALAHYVGFGNAKVVYQHPDLLNSHYRFDLLLTK